MRRRRADKQPSRPDSGSGDAQSIDELYGLEPVFEPDGSGAAHSVADSAIPGTAQFQSVQCPYCGESFDTLVDLSCGGAIYIEDCQICCRPIEFRLEVDHQGTLLQLATRRSD